MASAIEQRARGLAIVFSLGVGVLLEFGAFQAVTPESAATAAFAALTALALASLGLRRRARTTAPALVAIQVHSQGGFRLVLAGSDAPCPASARWATPAWLVLRPAGRRKPEVVLWCDAVDASTWRRCQVQARWHPEPATVDAAGIDISLGNELPGRSRVTESQAR